MQDLCLLAADGSYSICCSEAKVSSRVALKSFWLKRTQRKGAAAGKADQQMRVQDTVLDLP